MADHVIPIVPLIVNTYYPPNQPTPERCVALGAALRTSIKKFPFEKRIGILASGPPAKLNSGSSEIRNWMVMAGAAAGMRAAWQEYVPLYRAPAGTGCGMAFLEMAS